MHGRAPRAKVAAPAVAGGRGGVRAGQALQSPEMSGATSGCAGTCRWPQCPLGAPISGRCTNTNTRRRSDSCGRGRSTARADSGPARRSFALGPVGAPVPGAVLTDLGRYRRR